MGTLRVLITNITMAHRSGTETYVRDLAISLLQRGHTPLVYTTDPGQVSDELRAAGVPIIDDLTRVAIPPDVVHGHHHPETVTAMLQFPAIPAIFVCHDNTAWHDAPPRFPRLLRYVAVDETCRDRLHYEHAIPPEQVRVIPNSVDMKRFLPRGPLPQHPRRALVFSNYAQANSALQVLQNACEKAGLALDVIGAGMNRPCPRPEEILANYDIVFAKARCALESLAVGAAVVLYNDNLLGPLVRAADLDRLRRLNLGRRTLTRTLDADLVLDELNAYDQEDAAEVTRRIRATAGLELMVDDLIGLYREVIAEARAWAANPGAELAAAADYLRRLAPVRLQNQLLRQQIENDAAVRDATAQASRSQAECQRAQAEFERAQVECQRAQAQSAAVGEENDHLRRQIASLKSEKSQAQAAAGEESDHLRLQIADFQSQLAAIHGSRTVRIVNRLRRLPLVERLRHIAVRRRSAGTGRSTT